MSEKDLLTQEQSNMLSVIDQDLELADSTKRQYTRALTNFWASGGRVTDAGNLGAYAPSVSKSERAFLKSAIRKVTEGIAHSIKANVTPETVDQAQAALMRLEAVQDSIKVKASSGTKSHTWLSQRQIKALFDTCKNDIVGQRDKLALGLLVGAGLRRSEAVALKFEDITIKPVGERFRTVLKVKGKGAKDREVPISDKLADMLDKWRAVVGSGYVLRSLGMNREPGESLSAVGLFDIVRKRGAQIGKGDLAAHDLRRTYAQLGYEAGVPITQISRLLGHASVATTQRYLNLELDLEATISDFIPIE